MRPADLDFVRRSPRWPGWAVLALGVALGADTGVRVREASAALAQANAPADAARTAGRPRQAADPATQQEWLAVQRALADLALPWEALFASLEASLGPNVALLSIDPDPAREVLRMGGEARDFAALLDFVERLQVTPALADVHLLSHEIRTDVAQRPYRFLLAARWRTQP